MEKLNDNRVSKNTRPLLLIYMVVFITALAVADAAIEGFDVPENYITLFQILITTSAATYYGARSIEKLNAMKDY